MVKLFLLPNQIINYIISIHFILRLIDDNLLCFMCIYKRYRLILNIDVKPFTDIDKYIKVNWIKIIT